MRIHHTKAYVGILRSDLYWVEPKTFVRGRTPEPDVADMASKSQKGIFLNNKNPKSPKRFESFINFKQERRRYKRRRRRRRKRCLRNGNWISGKTFLRGVSWNTKNKCELKKSKKEIKESSKAPPPNLPSPPQRRVSKLALCVRRWPRA